MSKIRNIGRYKPQLHTALAAFALMLAAHVKEADLFLDVTPAALEKLNSKDNREQLDHIKLAVCRRDKDGNPYQFESPALTSALLKAVSQTNVIAKKAKTKTPEILFSETGFLYVDGAKFDHKALTIQQVKTQPKPAVIKTPVEIPAENEDENEDESEAKANKKTRTKKSEKQA